MKRELSVLIALVLLALLLAIFAPSFFAAGNLRDVALANVPVLLAAIGMTIVILTGQIDISIGSQFAICGVIAGLLAKAGLPMLAVVPVTVLLGCAFGSLNGFLVSTTNIPSIIATLATMTILRETLRWTSGGAWVQNLPQDFQFFGMTQATGEAVILIAAAMMFGLAAWTLRNLAAGRYFYATGSDEQAARLAGIDTRAVMFSAFAILGALTALAAVLNSVRFSDIQTTSGTGLELKAIAAVVVGGASINGGRATMIGTLLGVILLGLIGPALTFAGVNAFWEKAIQGLIILAAVMSDALSQRFGQAKAA